MIKEGRFREDLYYRLSMVEINVPGLAERKDDLPLLIRHFIDKFSNQFNKPVRGITQRASIMLNRYSWPGNVRELENVIGHGCMMTLGERIDVADLPDYLRAQPEAGVSPSPVLSNAKAASAGTSSLEESECQLILDALAQSNGNQSEAARRLRIGRDALRYKLKKYGLAGFAAGQP
jgi:DNA-binding NtrC family response regulator